MEPPKNPSRRNAASKSAAGCDDFIRKPYNDAEIFDILTKHLGVCFVYEEMQELGLTPDDFGNVVFIESKHNWVFVRKGLPQEIRDPLKRVVEEIYQSPLIEQLLVKYGKKK